MPEAYITFFSVSAGAGATLLGLIFVAVSISPERTFGKDASIERTIQAQSAFSALVNAFFVSLVALTPSNGIGWGALAFSIFGFQSNLGSVLKIFRERQSWITVARRLFLVIVSFVIYYFELFISLSLIQDPTNPNFLANLTSLICSIYGIGIVRAWELFGVDQEFFLRFFSLVEYVRTRSKAESDGEPKEKSAKETVDKEKPTKEASANQSETDK